MVGSAREVCGSVRVGEKNPKSVCGNDEVKSCGQEKGGDEEAKERDVWKLTKKKRERLKDV